MKRRISRRRFIELSAGTAVAASLGSTPAFAQATTTAAVTLDGRGSGQIFMGIGGLSGGGGTSRLLFDYPERQQKEILDYLFKPNYGANLHILKVEIGGDTNSTNGSEASHMRSATDQNYHRGYEWWLMEQARARNPHIKFYGLQWGAPGWFQLSPDIDPNKNFWSHDNITYLINWITNAKTVHGLNIDYIGGWNESGYNTTWYKDLKAALLSHGLATKVVASDEVGWAIATNMKNDPVLNEAIDILGSHYPNIPARTPTPDAISLNKPLWASENGSSNYNSGAGKIASNTNHNYIDKKLVASINWSLVAAWYPTLPFAGDGLMLAEEPWSGHYEVGKSIWVMAHYAQFTQPGWQFIDSACGYLNGNSANGSYITFKSSNGSDYSVIIETVGVTAASTVNFTVTGGLSTGTVHVWSTNLSSISDSDYFVHSQDITQNGGTFSLTVQPGYIYSLTTTSGQAKGTTTAPVSAEMRLPYIETFDWYESGKLARYFSDLMGAFETAPAHGRRWGKVYRQVITTPPIAWHSGSPIAPLTVMGDPNWSNYLVSVEFLLEQAGYVELIGNLTSQVRLAGAETGYHLRIADTGEWTLYREDAPTASTRTDTTLASGSVTIGLNTWHTLSLLLDNGAIQALIDGKRVADSKDAKYVGGQIGLMVSKWINAQFDNVFILPARRGFIPHMNYKIVNHNSSLVLEVANSATTEGAVIDQNTDTGSKNQLWTFTPVDKRNFGKEDRGEDENAHYIIRNVNSGMVLDDLNSATTNGSPIGQATANHSTHQQWLITAAGGGYYTIENVFSSLLLEVSQKSTAVGAVVDQWVSTGNTNQKWSIVEA